MWLATSGRRVRLSQSAGSRCCCSRCPGYLVPPLEAANKVLEHWFVQHNALAVPRCSDGRRDAVGDQWVRATAAGDGGSICGG
jgi:hypothetical protein